ncbi:hypothetical protein ACH46_09920 [Gordonia phthalatica]|uniref:Uncharacterized protein n=1 Tax=Gordonia phthalatica TaxID=1136941 RepID=A0A0N9NCG1_9ACTN|nr:hypothetical protein ACH46_09920 [Gordonia phthalatica]
MSSRGGVKVPTGGNAFARRTSPRAPAQQCGDEQTSVRSRGRRSQSGYERTTAAPADCLSRVHGAKERRCSRESWRSVARSPPATTSRKPHVFESAARW